MLRRVKSESGFTLLELLIVIVVIGILALLIIPNLTSAPKKARDTDRKTDLAAIQKALEEYFVSYSAYPASLNSLTTLTPPIIKAIPLDTLNTGVYVYTYTSASPYSSYTVKACLENGSDTGRNTANDTSCAPSNRSYTVVSQN